MTRSSIGLGVAIAVFGTVLWGCSSGGGGGGGGGSGQTDQLDDGPVNQEGADNHSNAGGAEAGSIDCSGAPVLETGVNLTPYYDEFPAAGLPGGLIDAERPAVVDLADDLPSPCHQGQLRSCVAWTVSYGLLTYYAQRDLDGWDDPDSTDQQFSPSFLFNQANAFRMGRSRANDCTRAGSFVSDVLAFAQESGCALMCQMPYVNDGSCQIEPSKEATQTAARYRIGSYWKVDEDVETMKVYLLDATPVIIVAEVGEPFMQLQGDTVYCAHNPDEGSAHCMMVVGYDDDRRAIKLFNSWGTAWGDEGYGWVSYDIWEDFVTESWVGMPDFAGVSGELTAGAMIVNPYADSDGDGIPDAVEVQFADQGYDPEVANPDGALDIDARPDGDLDGWPDEVELRFGTDPSSCDEFPYMPGYEYPDGFFDQFDGSEGVLEQDSDLAAPDDGSQAESPDQEADSEPDTEADTPADQPPPDVDPSADADNDGVPDWRDQCPDTLIGSIVGEDGCAA